MEGLEYTQITRCHIADSVGAIAFVGKAVEILSRKRIIVGSGVVSVGCTTDTTQFGMFGIFANVVLRYTANDIAVVIDYGAVVEAAAVHSGRLDTIEELLGSLSICVRSRDGSAFAVQQEVGVVVYELTVVVVVIGNLDGTDLDILCHGAVAGQVGGSHLEGIVVAVVAGHNLQTEHQCVELSLAAQLCILVVGSTVACNSIGTSGGT